MAKILLFNQTDAIFKNYSGVVSQIEICSTIFLSSAWIVADPDLAN